jgi:protein ImuB
MFACVYQPQPADDTRVALAALAQEFSPRYELTRGDLVTIDICGLDRLLGTPSTIAAELAREAAARGVRGHVALAATHTAAAVLALARPGVTVVEAGGQAAALAPLPVGILERIVEQATMVVAPLKRWGLRTLGELAALPAADLAARLGRGASSWQAIARGEDTRPLVPALPEERFDATLELEWPIEALESLSFVLTRLLEPLSTRLERRDRGAAVLHVRLRLGPPAERGEVHARRLELPTPMRDVRTLRTLALLDLESHPPAAPIECVTIAIDPTPGRVLQHTLFARAHPTPERLSTLIARLGALMGQDRIGAAAPVDSYRPGAFAMNPFATDHQSGRPSEYAPAAPKRGAVSSRDGESPESRASSPPPSLDGITPGFGETGLCSALRRCRQPVPARVVAEHDRPVRVTTDRRGYAGGSVVRAAGPWRTSGNWWAAGGERLRPCRAEEPLLIRGEASASERAGGRAPAPVEESRAGKAEQSPWNRDEWDVSLSDGGVYRIFRDRDTDAWFVDGIFD